MVCGGARLSGAPSQSLSVSSLLVIVGQFLSPIFILLLRHCFGFGATFHGDMNAIYSFLNITILLLIQPLSYACMSILICHKLIFNLSHVEYF